MGLFVNADRPGDAELLGTELPSRRRGTCQEALEWILPDDRDVPVQLRLTQRREGRRGAGERGESALMDVVNLRDWVAGSDEVGDDEYVDFDEE